MISRSVASGAVCLGCRLRLLGQATRPHHVPVIGTRPVSRHRPIQRWFSDEAPSHSNSKEEGHGSSESESSKTDEPPANEQDQSFSRHDDALFEYQEESHAVETRRPPRQKEENFNPTRRLGVRKRHLSGKKILTETSERLDTDMLGKPAYAIVMRDGGQYRPKKQPVAVEDSNTVTEPHGLFDIEEILSSQLEPPSESEFCDNIDRMRPKSEIYLSEREFRRLQHELEEGFLKSQLSHYLETFDGVKDQAKAIADNDTQEQLRRFVSRFAWIKSYDPWVHLASSDVALAPEGRSSRHLHGYLPPNASAKTRAAVQIMRDCWGLQIEEFVNGLGEMNIMLHSREYSLLMRGTRRFLRLLSDIYLEPGETMEAFNSSRMIRIVAPRPKAQTIIAEIDTTLERIRDHTFPLFWVTRDPTKIDQTLLDEVGRVTNSHVRLTDAGRRVQVVWIQIRGRDAYDVEDISHTVFRLLFTACQPDGISRRIHATLPPPAEETKARYLVDHTNKEKWAWKDKLSRWARYVLPIPTKDPNQLDNEDEVAKKSVSETSIQPSVELGLPIEWRHDSRVSEKTDSVRWSPNHTTTTSTVFGHLLHPHTSDLLPSLADLIKSPDRPRVFSPEVPHPMRLAQLNLDFNEFFPINSTILIRLVPRPVLRSMTRSPVLELRLAITESVEHWRVKLKMAGVHSLRAVTETQCHDVLHPSHAVDLRITQTRACALLGDSLDEWPPIASFLAKARLDLDNGKLEMPPQQRFLLPTRLFTTADRSDEKPNRKSAKRSGQKSPTEEELVDEEMQAVMEEVKKATDDPDRLHTVMYEFAGLELHRAVSVPHPTDPRFELTYTSIEAGQGGGRRAELSLGLRAAASTLSTSSSPTSTSPPATASAPEADLGGNTDTPAESTFAQTTAVGSSESENKNGTHQISTTAQELPAPVSQDDYLRACYEFARTAEYWSGSYSGAEQAAARNQD